MSARRTYRAHIDIPGGGSICVTATEGHQATGFDGRPLNASDPGLVQMSIIGGDGNSAAITFPDPVWAAAVRDALKVADLLSCERDRSLDQTAPEPA